MNLTRSQQTTAASKPAQATLPTEPEARRIVPSSSFEYAPKLSGYGLPCAKCHLYYAADLDVCPTCHSKERVSPVVTAVPAKVAQANPEPAPDSEAVEQEREEFLRQFKSQLFAAHAEVANVPASICNLGEHHGAEAPKAEICKPCYEHAQERADVCEAALHMDLKEAAQIIYDAVWSDPSDPSKTYRNAANALLTELRKRAGVTTLLGPFQPLSH